MFPSLTVSTFLSSLGRTVKLGLRVAPRSKPCVRLSDHMKAGLPAPPPAVDNYTGIPFPMYLNDRLGDCAIASPAHEIGAWTAKESGKAVLFSDQDIISAYSACSGYDPRTGANDNGCVLETVQEYWLRTGIGGRKIVAYAEIDPNDTTLVRQATHLFGGLTIGLLMPAAWQNQTGPNGVWGTGGGYNYQPGTWGGHAVPVVGYDAQFLYVVTWGQVQKLTWEALRVYSPSVGVFANISQDWATDGTAPNGVDVAALVEAFDAINGNSPAPVWPDPIPPKPDPKPGPAVTYTFAGELVTGGKITGTMAPVNVAVGSWLTDIGDWGRRLVDQADELVHRYGPAAHAVLDAARAFADAPGFGTAASLWAAVQAFGGVPARASMQAINWQGLIQFAEAVAEIVAKFLR